MCYFSSVSRTTWLLVCVGGCLGLALGASAPPAPPNPVAPPPAQAAPAQEDAEAGEAAEPAAEEAPQAPPNPYQAITARNVFGLKPPPPPTVAPDPQAQVTPSALKLVLISGPLGKAGFVLQEPGKPQVSSDLLREGEKDSTITNLEVLKIDARAMSVKVMYGNKELTLDFKSNGIAPPVGPALAPPGPMVAGRPGGPPGAPGPPGPGQPTQPVTTASLRAGLAQPGAYTADSGSGLRPIPTRPTRLGSDGSMGYGTAPVGGPARYGFNQPIQAQPNLYNPGLQAQPQPNLQAIQPQPQPSLPPEQQVIVMKAQEQQATREGIPFPPTPPVPGVDYQPGAPGSAQGQQSGPQFPPVPGAPIPLPPTPGR